MLTDQKYRSNSTNVTLSQQLDFCGHEVRAVWGRIVPTAFKCPWVKLSSHEKKKNREKFRKISYESRKFQHNALKMWRTQGQKRELSNHPHCNTLLRKNIVAPPSGAAHVYGWHTCTAVCRLQAPSKRNA